MVLRRVTAKLYGYYQKSCQFKRKDSYLSAFLKKIMYWWKDREHLQIYKCRFGNHYHIGHDQPSINRKRANTIPRFTLLDINGKLGIKYWKITRGYENG